MKIRKILIYPLCMLLMLVTGCAVETGGSEQLEEAPIETLAEITAPPGPSEGGRLKLSMRRPATLNPLLNEDVTVDNILKLLFMQVATLDENMRPVPMLAEDINFASDGLSAVVTLKDMYWHDGEKITSADLDFSIKTLKIAPEDSIYKNCADNILNTAVIDERTLKITYTHAFGAAEYLLCFPMIPQHYYQGEDKADSEKNMTPMGNNIYTFDSYDGRDHILLKANPHFKPYIQEIDILVTSDQQTDLSAFDQNLVDVLNSRLSDWGKYRGSKQTRIYEYATTYFDFIGFNFANPLLADLEMRRAIAHSLDLDHVVDDVYHSSAIRSYTPVCPQSWLYESEVVKYEYDPELAGIIFAGIIQPPDADGDDNNGDNATETLEEAEAETEVEVVEIVEESEEQYLFVVLVNEENDERVKIAGTLAGALKEIGASTRVDTVPFEEYAERLANRDYDIFIGGFNLTMIPDLSFMLHSSQAASGSNYFGYKNDLMDALLALSFGYATPTGYRSSMSDLQKLVAEDLPFLSICFRKSALITDKKISGEIEPRQDNIFNGIENWYIQ